MAVNRLWGTFCGRTLNIGGPTHLCIRTLYSCCFPMITSSFPLFPWHPDSFLSLLWDNECFPEIFFSKSWENKTLFQKFPIPLEQILVYSQLFSEGNVIKCCNVRGAGDYVSVSVFNQGLIRPENHIMPCHYREYIYVYMCVQSAWHDIVWQKLSCYFRKTKFSFYTVYSKKQVNYIHTTFKHLNNNI